jgi:hypothetical protein
VLTLFLRVAYEDLITMPWVVDGSCFDIFTHVVYMHFWAVLYHLLVKVIDTLKQDGCVSSYKHAGPSWPHILRTIQLQHSYHRFRYPSLCFFFLSLPLVETMAMHSSVMKYDILCELYVDTYSDIWWLWSWKFGRWEWGPHNCSM